MSDSIAITREVPDHILRQPNNRGRILPSTLSRSPNKSLLLWKPGAQPSKQTAVTRLRETRYESLGKLRLKIEMAVAEGIMGSDDVLWIWKLLETAEIAAALSA